MSVSATTPRSDRGYGKKTPLSNTGLNVSTDSPVIIDTVTTVFNLHSFDDLLIEVQTILRQIGLHLSAPDGYRRNGYHDSCAILADGLTVGFFAFGGNENAIGETCCLYFTGSACECVSDWQLFHDFVSDHEGWITRVDLAYDSFDGSRDIDLAIANYEGGDFTNARAPRAPNRRFINDFGSGEGCTFYVGSRGSNKMVRVYEKGKQLGEPRDPWVRWELELRNKQQVIPLEVLVDPVPYFAGSYPALSFVSELVKTIAASVVRGKISYRVALAHLQHHYGRLINVMMMQHGGDIESFCDEVLGCSRDGVPRRLLFDLRGKSDEFDCIGKV